ncbi:DUF3073 domain-containing protein [Kribbia dieselivorans]|uniref:DUF3073 domain-containing protein n=1 Tax=Kribbia dieselivorans TaxID=331526 RepID=UPI0008384433|nr:DUF3073 domain-containing protein [Kribbia dieselivorans]
MGRGRAKAKQTKVARELKYYSPETDLEALARELHGGNTRQGTSRRSDDDSTEPDDDPYQEWASGQD